MYGSSFGVYHVSPTSSVGSAGDFGAEFADVSASWAERCARRYREQRPKVSIPQYGLPRQNAAFRFEAHGCVRA